MSVLAVSTPGISTGRHDLLVIIAERLNERFPNMSNPTPGAFDTEEMLLYKIAVIVGNIPSTGGTGVYSGTGSPEGVQPAAVGSIYIDISDAQHPVTWEKTSGTGNTGWVSALSV